jgi:hypothetical protein
MIVEPKPANSSALEKSLSLCAETSTKSVDLLEKCRSSRR